MNYSDRNQLSGYRGHLQSDRHNKWLDPSLALIDDRSTAEMIEQLFLLAEDITYYNDKARPDGDFSRFLQSSDTLLVELFSTKNIEQEYDFVKSELRKIHSAWVANTFTPEQTLSSLEDHFKRWIWLLQLLDHALISNDHADIELRERIQSAVQLLFEIALQFERYHDEGLPVHWWELFDHFGVYPDTTTHSSTSDPTLYDIEQLKFLARQFYDHLNLVQEQAKTLRAQILNESNSRPQDALFMSIIDLMDGVQDEVNQIPYNLLNSFYMDQLGLTSSDRDALYTYVFGMLETDETSVRIPKDTRFEATHGEESFYLSLPQDTVLSSPSIIEERKVFLTEDEHFEQPDILSIDTTIPNQNGLVLSAELDDQEREISVIGFELFTPLLLIDCPDRHIRIEFSLNKGSFLSALRSHIENAPSKRSFGDNTSNVEILSELLDDAFAISYQAAEEMHTLSEHQIDSSLEESEEGNFLFTLSLILNVDDPVAIDHQRNGLAKLAIKLYDDRDFLYSVLSQIHIDQIKIYSEGINLRTLKLFNDIGALDPSTSLQPFTARPEIGNRFYIGHPVVFSNQLESLRINLKWSGLPSDSNGFPGHYNGYHLVKNNEDFKVSVALQGNGFWFPDDDKQVINLFTTMDESENAQAEHAISPIRRINEIDLDELQLPTYPGYNPHRTPQESRHGFLKLELAFPAGAFGHSRYQELLQLNALKNAKEKKSNSIILEPYTPTISSISLDYTISEVISDPAHTTRIQCYDIHSPFTGFATTGMATLLPSGSCESSLYVKLQDITGPSDIHMFFHIGNAVEDDYTMAWNYFNGKDWIQIPESRIVKDETHQLQNSGIVTLRLDEELAESLKDYHWLRITCSDYSILNNIKNIRTQAFKLLFLQDSDSTTEFNLTPDTLKGPDTNIDGLKGIEQPYGFFNPMVIDGLNTYDLHSETIRTRNRAATLWDLETKLLSRYSALNKIKTLCHFDHTFTWAPGHITLVLMPYLQASDLLGGNWPRFSQTELQDIKQYAESLLPLQSKVHVLNPRYEEIHIKATVIFKDEIDPVYYSDKIQNDIRHCILHSESHSTSDLDFDKGIHTSLILSAIKQLDYIKEVTNFSCFQSFDDNMYLPYDLNETNVELLPSRPNNLLVPSHRHFIMVADSREGIPERIGVENMMLETDFVINKPTDTPIERGIGTQKVGYNLIIGVPHRSEQTDSPQQIRISL